MTAIDDTARLSPYASLASLWPRSRPERGHLGTRALNVLLRSGARTVKDVTAMSAEDIADLRNAGTGTLAEVRRALAEHGLSLAGDSAGVTG